MFYYENPITLLITIASIVISLLAHLGIKNAYAKYSKMRVSGGLTGADVARRIAGDTASVTMHNGGKMSDHFDPRTRTVALSPDVYNGSTVAALGIAAHEAGHALQHGNGYAPIKLRNAILPIAQIGSTLATPLVIAGLVFGSMSFLIDVGIILFVAVIAFQIITLPVEFNASSRAMAMLKDNSYLNESEARGARSMLNAAAMTYEIGRAHV